ncbi:MAG: nickel-dependent lactate racemase [Verrucomicrobiota bacterium]|nr:nickel-dependent lactate racemase [Verrucomicrobiota bacterium]MDG1890926.1 nickel-dependent lactate racemase [Verrucomicrobiota bacterium]
MNIDLAYGNGHISIDLPQDRTTIIQPNFSDGLADERAAITHALEHPIGAAPLLESIDPDTKLCILFTDLTRATPNERIIPWLLTHLGDHPRENIVLLNQLGTHRPNTKAELNAMLTPEVVDGYRVINHDCEDPLQLLQVGQTRTGAPALLNKHALEADLRIVTGFIEPHFFAGFSGGPKGLMPGVAGIETVMSNHGADNIGNPRSTFGITEGNPLWEELRDIALRAGPSFLLNVSLNHDRAITGVFAGDLVDAHRAGCKKVQASAMQSVAAPFDIVVTTNSGYPLDLNLYQGVKGMSAGARILKEGGLLILACECREGVPAKSPLDKLLRSAGSPAEILTMLSSPGFVRPEQWQAQIQALIQSRAEVLVHSTLDDETLSGAHLKPCRDIERTITERLALLGDHARVAVLPQGPLTIPYLA